MGLTNKGLSLASRGLQYKLRIAFSLMSIIPLLVCVYLFFVYNPYTSKIPFSNLQIIISLVVSAGIAAIGFLLAKQIVDPIVTISSEVKNIANGQYNKTIEISREDEIGDLGNALNQITRHIRDNMDELRNYGERTKEINDEINKRVIVLSGLLQISNLITQGAALKEIFDITVSRLAQLKNSTWVLLVIKEETDNFKVCAQQGISDNLQDSLLTDGARKIFDVMLLNKSGLIVGKQQTDSKSVELQHMLGTINVLFMPIFRHARVAGFLGIGTSHPEVEYTNDDAELLVVFAKQISIAIENDYLANRVQKLEIKDALTGLYNKSFILNRLDEEIKRAVIYQRPCAFLLFSIGNFREFLSSSGELASEDVLKKVAKLLEKNCREIDKVARYGDSEFAVILPEKNKKQSVILAEEIREKIENFFVQEKKVGLAVCGAVSENPIDGACAKDLAQKAESLLKLAKEEKNVIKS
ncbi:MAG: diguanylate cyclase [Candidatus Omnitrophica bacterium]|nr:diguanylate cyclase [Candidatus Omnitrophota bacterium]